jgi:Protein of unknown function (DUF2917)
MCRPRYLRPLERKAAGMDSGFMKVRKGHVMSIPRASTGCRVSCLSGVLWLTRENDPEDYIITADSDLVIARHGHSVIEAITDCVICITPDMQGGVHDHV